MTTSKKTVALTMAALIAATLSTAVIAQTAAPMGQGMGAGMGQGMGAGPMPLANFDEMDADKDGKVTQEEVTAFLTARATEADADKDGKISVEELVAMREKAEAARKALVALGEGPGFRQPHGQSEVFGAGAQQGFAGAGHSGPVGHFEAGDPFALVECGVVGTPHFVDGVKLRREGQIVAARRVCGQRRQQDFHFHDIPVCRCARGDEGACPARASSFHATPRDAITRRGVKGNWL